MATQDIMDKSGEITVDKKVMEIHGRSKKTKLVCKIMFKNVDIGQFISIFCQKC